MDLSHLDERSQHFQLEILHVSDPIGAALNDTDFVVESFHKTEGHFMIRTAVTDDAWTAPIGLDKKIRRDVAAVVSFFL